MTGHCFNKGSSLQASVAELVDALDLKSNWAYNPVPVQVWPEAFILTHTINYKS